MSSDKEKQQDDKQMQNGGFDLEKLQAVAELGEVIRLQNEALERLVAFRRARPYMMMPNLAKMVEENLKENVTVLYKELNNLHKPAEQQTRYICNECKMAFVSALPGGICDECRSRMGPDQPRAYVPYDEGQEKDQGQGTRDEGQGKETGAAEEGAEVVEPAEDVESAEAVESAGGTEQGEAAEQVEATEPTNNNDNDDLISDAYKMAIGGEGEYAEEEISEDVAKPINPSEDDADDFPRGEEPPEEREERRSQET